MIKGSEEIFIYHKDHFERLTSRSMREGVLGTVLEDALQRILEENPGVIPGKQIDPASNSPPRFFLLKREMTISDWSLDHLFVDQYGKPTLVEAKLVQNPQSRREVVGQIIEYAANALEHWSDGKARLAAQEFYAKQKKDISVCLSEYYGEDFHEDEFWHDFEEHLESGRLRLIIAADEIRPEVRRMIEYLNYEMANVDIFGLELACFANDDESFVMVPRLVGQSQMNADRKKESKEKTNWTEGKIEEEIKGISDSTLSQRLTKLFELVVAKKAFKSVMSEKPQFGVTTKGASSSFLWVHLDGEGYLAMRVGCYPGSDILRKNLFEVSQKIGFLKPSLSMEQIKDGRYWQKSLGEIDKENFEEFAAVIDRCLPEEADNEQL